MKQLDMFKTFNIKNQLVRNELVGLFSPINGKFEITDLNNIAKYIEKDKNIIKSWYKEKMFLRSLRVYIVDHNAKEEDLQYFLEKFERTKTKEDVPNLFWKECENYKISNYGKVYCKQTNKYILPKLKNQKHIIKVKDKIIQSDEKRVCVSLDGKTYPLAELIGLHFPLNRVRFRAIHKDGDIWNNYANNLIWVDKKEFIKKLLSN